MYRDRIRWVGGIVCAWTGILGTGILVIGSAVISTVGISAEPPTPVNAAAPPIRKITSDHLPNAYRLTDKLFSGGQPEGEPAFAELRALGVKTVISVDGAQPDVAAAKKYGLRYVHLPHGYDGIADARLLELAKAVRDLPGAVYLHCHHGKHRSPAAAAAACVTIGLLGNEQALAVLKTAGTSPNYLGLYDTVGTAQRVDGGVLDRLQVEFRESVNVAPMAESMIAIEHLHDRLKSVAAAQWKAPPDHPDVDPPHEALQLKEQFAELLRTDEARSQGEKFLALARGGEAAAGALETALRAAPPDEKGAALALAKVTANCQACHQSFRDVPLREKSKAKGVAR
ncbi:MAG: hypothetical protein AB7O59_21030 [Pirellulales bacterium]